MLERTALAYFGSDTRLYVAVLVVALSGVAAVLRDRGSQLCNRLQFISAAALIVLLLAVTGMVVQAAIPAMVGSPPPPPWAQPSAIPEPPSGSTLDVPQKQPEARFDPITAVPVEAQNQPSAGSQAQNDYSQFTPVEPPQQPNESPKNGWVLMLADLARFAAVGYLIGLVAMARCRDIGDKKQRGHAIVIVILGAIFPLTYVLLLGQSNRKNNNRPNKAQNATSIRHHIQDYDNILRKKIIFDYGDTLLKTTNLDADIFDVSILPHPKEKILAALLYEIAHNSDESEVATFAGSARSLSVFQHGVGATPLKAPVSMERLQSANNEELKKLLTAIGPFMNISEQVTKEYENINDLVQEMKYCNKYLSRNEFM